MQTARFEVPSLYGDHHVTEVRRLLLEMPGVVDVYASSAFQVIEVTYDPAVLTDLHISVKLDEAGYLGEWTIPVETGAVAERVGAQEKPFFRHTTVYEGTPRTVTFAQKVSYSGRPLWPCPGLGAAKKTVE